MSPRRRCQGPQDSAPATPSQVRARTRDLPRAHLAGALLRRASASAALLALLAWVGLALGGCVIPQDDTLFVGPRNARNRPPRILENQVSPQTRIIREFGNGTCRQTFEVLATDPDVNDLLSVYWFVDYVPGQASTDKIDLLSPSDGPERNDRATFVADLTAANSKLRAPGLHTVEAVLVDRQFDVVKRQPTQEIGDNPDGGAAIVVDEGYAVTYAWTVETVTGVCP